MNELIDRLASPGPHRPTLRPDGAKLGRWLVVAVLMTIASRAWSGTTCTVASPGVVFGSYDPFSAVALDITGTITVTCNTSAPSTISLSPGGGTYASRKMTSGAHTLNYNLYTTTTRTIVWGDGTAGTSTVAANGTIVAKTVYGRIPALQNAFVGSYSDTITVTIAF